MILTSELMIRWSIATIVIVLLLAAFYLLLKMIKEKGLTFNNVAISKEKMKIIEQFYLDSKNKIVKVKDGDKVITILLGSSASFIKEDDYIAEEKNAINNLNKEVEEIKDVK